MDQSLILDSLRGIGPFLIYVGLALGLVAIYCAVYMAATAHDELKLIRQNNLAAALAFSGSLVGYSLPLAAAALGSRALIEFILWGVIAILVQIGIYWIFRLVLLRDVSGRIDNGEVASGALLGAVSLVGGIINASAMTV